MDFAKSADYEEVVGSGESFGTSGSTERTECGATPYMKYEPCEDDELVEK